MDFSCPLSGGGYCSTSARGAQRARFDSPSVSRSGKSASTSRAIGSFTEMSSFQKTPVRARPSRFLISNFVITHLDRSQFLADNGFPAGFAGNYKPALRVTLHQTPDSPAARPYHSLVTFRDFALADRKRFLEFFWVRAEGRVEKERIVKLVPHPAIKCYEDRV